VIRNILGFAIIIMAVLAGLYVGGWVMFIGGIVDIIEAAKATPVEALPIAVGLLKVMMAMVTGWIVAIIGASIGAVIIK
jgi:hypothetical protein